MKELLKVLALVCLAPLGLIFIMVLVFVSLRIAMWIVSLLISMPA